MNENLYTVLITLITVAGSAGAWRFYESKLKLNNKLRDINAREGVLFREDLRERVSALESKLEEKEREKEELQNQISDLKSELAQYKVRLEYLEMENNSLKNES
jgi:predicted nuclease with TOPRIM domain